MPTLAMVSTDIRRDLIAPLRYFARLRIAHFYRRASYGDLVPGDLDESHVAYNQPVDLYRHLQRMRPDMVQGVEPFSIRLLPYLYVVYRAARRRHIPLVVVTLENRPLAIKHGIVLARLLRVLLRPVFSYARLIIHLNEGSRRNVLSVGPYEAKLRRLMYGTWGVDTAEFTPQRNGHEPDLGPGPVVLFVGRLHAEKGVFDLLEAYSRVKPRLPQSKLILIGDGPARGEIEQLIAARRWIGRVALIGTLKNRDLPPYFRAADVFVSPSVTTRKWEEQVGMTNIQAMACGVPVISTQSGAIPEFVPRSAGLLVPEHSPRALAEAILRMLADADSRRRAGEAGRACAVEHYDAQKNVRAAEESLLTVYREFASGAT